MSYAIQLAINDSDNHHALRFLRAFRDPPKNRLLERPAQAGSTAGANPSPEDVAKKQVTAFFNDPNSLVKAARRCVLNDQQYLNRQELDWPDRSSLTGRSAGSTSTDC